MCFENIHSLQKHKNRMLPAEKNQGDNDFAAKEKPGVMLVTMLMRGLLQIANAAVCWACKKKSWSTFGMLLSYVVVASASQDSSLVVACASESNEIPSDPHLHSPHPG